MESIFLTEIKMTLKKAYLVFSFVFMVKEISIKWFKNERIISNRKETFIIFKSEEAPNYCHRYFKFNSTHILFILIFHLE